MESPLFSVGLTWNQPPSQDLQFKIVLQLTFSAMKKVRFSQVPATQLHRNPHRSARGSLLLSAVLHPHLLGGLTVAIANLTTTFENVCSLSYLLNTTGDLRGIMLVCKAQSELRLLVYPFPVYKPYCTLRCKYIHSTLVLFINYMSSLHLIG